MSLLEIKNLTVSVSESFQAQRIVNDVSFAIAPLSVTALVGSSGSGKTTTGLAILQLLSSGLTVTSGEILFNEQNLLALSEKQMTKIRAREISMIFQEPLYAFNPVFTIGTQIAEVLTQHTDVARDALEAMVLEWLDLVGIKEPKRVAKSYPHQLSGGMRQRAMIAQAVCAHPKLVIADEPTSNLDVTLQARIIELFEQLRKDLSLSFLLITHDLGMVKHFADYVLVLNQGQLVEQGAENIVLQTPQHPYTKQLIEALNI